ncbi:MAG: type II toxin-antitoxin system HicB family antitoxin [Thermodesulfobacteriota bacterium]
MPRKFTAIVRRSKLEYVAVCLELNVAARGDNLAEVERNLKEAIELYLSDLQEHQETLVEPMPIEEFIEFLRDTEPDWVKEPKDGFILKPLEIHEVPSYV